MNSGIIVLLTLVVVFYLIRKTISMYITTHFAGTPISLFELLMMQFRNIDSSHVANAYIMLRKANIEVDLRELETAYLLKHDLENITAGMILSRKKNTPLTFAEAKAADKRGVKMKEESAK